MEVKSTPFTGLPTFKTQLELSTYNTFRFFSLFRLIRFNRISYYRVLHPVARNINL
jgi:hypothetical protein